MLHRRVIPLCMVMLMASSTHACSRAFAIDLGFAEGSADLEKIEVVKLTVWLDKWKKVFSRFESVMVDGIAPPHAQDAKTLSRRRAAIAANAVHQLLDGVPIHESAHLDSPSSPFKGGNYAGIDLMPFQEDMPSCG